MPAESKKNYVYVVAQEGGGQPWKIGKTTDPVARLKGLQTGSPMRLVYIKVAEAHPSLESSLHRQFAQYRGSGEWFHLPPEKATMVLARLDGEMWVYKVVRNQEPRRNPTRPRQEGRQPWTKKRKPSKQKRVRSVTVIQPRVITDREAHDLRQERIKANILRQMR